MAHKTKVAKIDIGDVVTIKGKNGERTILKERSRNTKCSSQDSKRVLRATNPTAVLWNLHCNESISDGAVPVTEEVSSNGDIQSKLGELNVNASEFRPKRTAAIIGSIKMNDMVANETGGQ